MINACFNKDGESNSIDTDLISPYVLKTLSMKPVSVELTLCYTRPWLLRS